MSVRLGINPITWTNDDVPELGGDTPLETCLAETAAGRLSRHRARRQVSAHRARCWSRSSTATALSWSPAGMTAAFSTARSTRRCDAIPPHLTLLRDLGAKHVVYADTSRGRHDAIYAPISQRPACRDEEWPAYGAQDSPRLAERMADFGVGMAFHHHMGTIVETDAEIDRLMATPARPSGLLFDTGHCLFSGGDPAGAAAPPRLDRDRAFPLQGRAPAGCWTRRGART